MSVRTLEPAVVRAKSVSSASSRGRRAAPAFLDRIDDDRSDRIRSHSQSLVLVDRNRRSLRDIDDEIRALEIQREREREAEIYERKAFRDEHKAAEEFRLARRLRDPPPRDLYGHREELRYPRDDGFLIRERSTSRLRANDVDLYENSLFGRSRSEHRNELVVYDRFGHPTYYKKEKSPPRNVVRVEKDRRGRMALVRSSR